MQASPDQLNSQPARGIDSSPAPATHVRLEVGDVLVLARLCLENQAEFVHRKMTDFWIKISVSRYIIGARSG